MFLHEVYRPECIKLDLEAEDKDEVFEELTDHFCVAAKNGGREELLRVLREREAKMSTGIRRGIAIPHGKTGAVSEVAGALGISRKGIDYDALDGEPVYIIFMFFSPAHETESHLRLLQRLAELLSNPQFYTELLAQTNSQDVHRLIKKYEEMLLAQ